MFCATCILGTNLICQRLGIVPSLTRQRFNRPEYEKAHTIYQRFSYSNTPSRFGTMPGFERVLPLSITNATCRPRLALSRANWSQAITWRSPSMPPTWANVAAHAGFAYLSFRWRRCSSLSARISRICPTTLSPFFSAISRTAFRDSR